MSDKFSGEKPDDIPQSEWDASIAFKNRVDVASMSACEFIARARMDAKAEERREIQTSVQDLIASADTSNSWQLGYRQGRLDAVTAIRNRKGA
jgi:hypothetical protein